MLTTALMLAMFPSAHACGGFFCDTQPILQTSERIVFAVDDEKVEAHVQIAYEGPARQFAWVVPSPEIPELFVSTDELFSRLDPLTNPRFDLRVVKEDCHADGDVADIFDTDFAFDTWGGDTAIRDVQGVTVVAREDVGPYETSVLQATDANALLVWLNLNGYRLPGSYADAMAPYLADGSYFVALRLQNNKDAGDLTPLGMRYDAPKAGIPLVLTSIAAVEDMRVDTYVLGPARAVPDNFLHVEINKTAIDWLNGGANYEEVITKAADEAGGHAFATDFAGPTSSLPSNLFSTSGFDLATLRGITDPATYADAMFNQGFPANTAVLGLLATHIPMPASVTVDADTFYACVGCYADELAGQAFDPVALTEALDAAVVQPMEHAGELMVTHPWLTRLRSSVSPAEMTADPGFVFNADMPAQSHIHQATLYYECDGGEIWEATRRLEIDNGLVMPMPSERYLFEEAETTMEWVSRLGLPTNRLVEMTSAVGTPMAITDNTEQIRETLEALSGVTPPTRGEPSTPTEPGTEQPATPEEPPTTTTAVGCGCNGAGGLASALWMAPLMLLRRRRNRR